MALKIKLTFLGTSAQIPTAKKNHTGIFFSYDDENILVDCGEGTQRQFRKAKLNPMKITRLLITHWHGDHVLGIPGLLQTLSANDYNKTLFIYGPKGTKKFMKEILNVFVFSGKISFKVEEVGEGRFFETDDFFLESKKIIHGIPTNAYSFTTKGKIRIDKKKLKKYDIETGPFLKKLKQGKDIKYKNKKYFFKDLTYGECDKKISFVLDSLFEEKVIPFVENSNFLICESTYGSDKKEMAKEYKHLTSEQAAKIAKSSNSSKLILTHLSSRYDLNQKKILNEAKKIFKNVCIAKDLDYFEI
jgi:ribonuclease Z